MYVSLTYPFNIVQHTLSHIVEHRKLEGTFGHPPTTLYDQLWPVSHRMKLGASH